MRGSWMSMAAWHFDPPATRYPLEGSARLALPLQSPSIPPRQKHLSKKTNGVKPWI